MNTLSRGTGVLIILPTYNEAAQIIPLTTDLRRLLPDAHVVIVDDASPDGTGKLAEQYAATDAHVRVIHRTAKLGLGTAYVTGFRYAQKIGADYVVQMDADGSHLIADLPRLLAAAYRDKGLVIGTRWIAGGNIIGWAAHRRWISKTGTWIAQRVLRSRLHDLTSGYRVCSTRWLSTLNLDRLESQGYGFQVEVAWTLERFGCPITEVPITFAERQQGVSKISVAIIWEALIRVLRWGFQLRFTPDRLSTQCTPENTVPPTT